eukprot:UN0111
MCPLSPVCAAGGVLLSTPSPSPAPEGMSLVNVAVSKRAVQDSQINAVKETIRNSSNEGCEVGSSIQLHSRIWQVIRMGFGDYKGEVRAIRLSEDPRQWTAGRWISCALCLPLLLPARVSFAHLVQDAMDPPKDIHAGTIGFIVGFDSDGDVLLQIDGRCGNVCIFRQDAEVLILR